MIKIRYLCLVVFPLLHSFSTSVSATEGNVYAPGVILNAGTYQNHPVYGLHDSWYKHPANKPRLIVDINVIGDNNLDDPIPLYAPEDGTIAIKTSTGGWGRSIEWTNSSGTESLFMAHLHTFGETGVVDAGEIIGYVGGSFGYSVHLHIESSNGPLVLSGQEIIPGLNSEPDSEYISNGPLGSLVDVYRFWSGNKKCHFYTANTEERNSIITNLSDVWDYEGSAFTGLSQYFPGSDPVHRYWSNVTGCHFYTINPDEKALTDINPEWVYEGVAYYAYRTSSGGSDTTPLYRFYSPVYKSHFYTVSIEERDHVIDNDSNWIYEGIGYWVSKGTPTPARLGASGTKPLHCGSMSQKECNAQIVTTIVRSQ